MTTIERARELIEKAAQCKSSDPVDENCKAYIAVPQISMAVFPLALKLAEMNLSDHPGLHRDGALVVECLCSRCRLAREIVATLEKELEC